MNNVQIMSTSPQTGTSKASGKSTSVSKTAKSSGFDDVLQKSQAQAQEPKAAAQDAKDTAESAADETEASAAAAATAKNPAAKTKAKGKDARQGTKNADAKDDKAAITDDGTDILADAAQGQTPYFTGLDKVKFRNPVKPGDVYETECEIIRSKGPFYFCKGKGTVNGKTAVTAEFSFALVGQEG